MFNTQGYSLSDIAAATGENKRDDSFGSGAWWIIILFLFVFMGGGWGSFGGGNGAVTAAASGALTRADLCQDMNFQGVENGVRGIQQGLCDGFYAMNTSLLNGFGETRAAVDNGFHGVDNAVCQLGYQTQQGFNTLAMNGIQNTNAITAQLSAMAANQASCCCQTQKEIEQGFCQLNYNLATQSCDTRRAISDSARDIIDNQNAGTRAVLDFLTQDKIATLQSENQTLRFAASQQAQNQYLVSALAPQPRPSYIVPNPYTGYSYGYGYTGSCCGCGA
jgi:hypothetical protein